MSCYACHVGIIKIKEKYSDDFDDFFHRRFEELRTKEFRDFLKNEIEEEFKDKFIWPNWKCSNFKESWHGKYISGYDRETRLFQFRNEYNQNNYYWRESFLSILDFLEEEVAEKVIYLDYCDEYDLDRIGSNPYLSIEE